MRTETARNLILSDMVVKIMQGPCSPFDVDKFATPLLKQLRERGQKRKASQAFSKTADALDELELAPRMKRVTRRPPPVLTIYVRKNTEKAYNAIMLEEVTAESLRNAVSDVYGPPASSIKSFELRCESGTSAVSDLTVEGFDDEDVFNISLDYDNAEGVCNVILEISS